MIHSAYSPLFTLGLLAERCMGSSSSRPMSSSPVDATPSVSNVSQKANPSDDASAFYFTLQTGRDTVELRSFLYLDLAEYNRPMAGHRRKPSTMSKSTSWTCTTDVHSNYDLSRSEKPMIITPAPPVPSVPTLRRSSKESLRNIPSPKPAPSATLPDLPVTSDSRSPTSSTFPSPIQSEFPSLHRASRSAPVVFSSLLSPTAFSRRTSSLRSESISSNDRRKSRMDALACLEGRSRAANRIPRSGLRRNFMSLSDDEDDESSRGSKTPSEPSVTPRIQVEDFGSLGDVEDEADAIIPALSRKPDFIKLSKPPRPSQKPATRKRRSTIDTWFPPFRSFIDLKDDDTSSWNWRSFIEIGGVS
ncbi:hypothetical protein HYDPIDRAFT_111007 [Hydnomerulius pinastri MD-312]|uniref:Uncharacterized protein n=1 Tax=Hydnomerulius pinastri MD-312 TaxID=994086 RepID=A0A0C9WAS6_9AGAM|nr:hypothetical protein HYDPIDRAFT_111007 [Hydnomerulius pinastri MD-312]